MVRYRPVDIYICTQTVLEESLYMGMSMVKALIFKVGKARRKGTPIICTTNQCFVSLNVSNPNAEESQQKTDVKEVRKLNPVPTVLLPLNSADGTTHMT